MGIKSKVTGMFPLVLLCCGQLSWSNITIKLQDSKNAPIQGVSCSQSGGTPALSDATGNLTLTNVTSIYKPQQRAEGNYLLSQIPLSNGETALLSVINTKGQNVLQRKISLGEKIEFSKEDRGVYFVAISSSHIATRGRFINLGQGFRFEGIAVQGNTGKSLAKTNAALAASITCSKAGFATQVYQLMDGSSNTIDFTKLSLVPLFDAMTVLQPDAVEETPTALITRFADRARDRHAREDEYHNYYHYLAHYWESRTAIIEIIDEVAKGGDVIKINVTTQWKLGSTNFRAFYRGIGTVAEYHSNINMDRDPTSVLKYHTQVKQYPLDKFRPLKIGDRMEIEVSQFLDAPPIGRANYYGTTVLYIVGKGLVPWQPVGVFGDASTERESSYPIPEVAWLGGNNTLPYNTSNEPGNSFIQMAANLAPINGQQFVLGRRVHHTNMISGLHDEPDNPVFDEMVGKVGGNYVNSSCTGCHHLNGRSIPPATGSVLSQYIVKVGDANGNPHPKLGKVLQPLSTTGTPEGTVTLASWTENNGLRSPVFGFGSGPVPTNYSARISPQLVGLGLLEAVSEANIQALADPDDANGDGVSGRMNIVTDYANGIPHLGRFGWKAGKASLADQIAGAFNTDMGVMTSIAPTPDCGSEQGNCATGKGKMTDSSFQRLVDYVGLLGVSARRDLKDPVALQGEALFNSAGCAVCHAPTLTTTAYHPKFENRKQTIHPYTDLLLHDMGPGLADNLPEGNATGAEWRTAPLWNIGLTAAVSGGEGYLHDGRARTLNEAILWHGGEGAKAAANFKAMSASDAAALVKFLKSL